MLYSRVIMMTPVPFLYQQKKHQKGIPSLYALKAICAFFVVAIHCGNWGKEYLMPIFTVAVPCFFAISGYFLYTGDTEKEIQHAWKWFRKIILITLSTNLFYYLFNSALEYSYSPRELLINIITGSQISAPLWYLTSLWEALLTFILIRKVYPKLLVAIPFCFIIHLITTRYSFLLFEEMPKGPFRMGTNFITIALPFICIGYFLAKNKDKLLKLPGIFLYPLIFAIAIWIEYSFFLGTQIRMAAYLIVTPFFAISLLLFCLKYPNFFTDFLV